MPLGMRFLGRGQRLLPQSHYVSTRVQISVDFQPTRRTCVDTVSEGERLPMSTARAVLTRVGRIHGDILPTGPCRLVRKTIRELVPRCVMNALGQRLIAYHSVDRQI